MAPTLFVNASACAKSSNTKVREMLFSSSAIFHSGTWFENVPISVESSGRTPPSNGTQRFDLSGSILCDEGEIDEMREEMRKRNTHGRERFRHERFGSKSGERIGLEIINPFRRDDEIGAGIMAQAERLMHEARAADELIVHLARELRRADLAGRA